MSQGSLPYQQQTCLVLSRAQLQNCKQTTSGKTRLTPVSGAVHSQCLQVVHCHALPHTSGCKLQSTAELQLGSSSCKLLETGGQSCLIGAAWVTWHLDVPANFTRCEQYLAGGLHHGEMLSGCRPLYMQQTSPAEDCDPDLVL